MMSVSPSGQAEGKGVEPSSPVWRTALAERPGQPYPATFRRKDELRRMNDEKDWTAHSSFILHPSSFILHPSSFILHPSSFILHPSSFILHNSSFLSGPPGS